MGILSAYKEAKLAKEAAEQMWTKIRVGVNFEIPLSLSPTDPTMRAIVELQRKYPQVQLRMYQSRGLVLGLHHGTAGQAVAGTNARVGREAWGLMNQGGYLPPVSNDFGTDALVAGHEAFLRSQKMDPEVQLAEAREQEQKRRAINDAAPSVRDAEPAAAAPSAPPTAPLILP